MAQWIDLLSFFPANANQFSSLNSASFPHLVNTTPGCSYVLFWNRLMTTKRNPLVSIHVSRLTASYSSQRCVLKGDFGLLLFATLYALRRPGFTGRLISWDGVVDSRSSYRALWLDIFHQYHNFYPEDESTLKVWEANIDLMRMMTELWVPCIGHAQTCVSNLLECYRVPNMLCISYTSRSVLRA